MIFTLVESSGRPRFKRPNEKFSIGIDFTNDLETGDAVSARTTTALDADTGQDVTGTFVLSDALASNVVSALINGGTDGKKYRVIFKATTQNARIYEHEVVVDVRAAG